MIAPIAALELDSPLPDGVAIREVTELADFKRIGAMEQAVWGGDERSWIGWLHEELVADPESLHVFVAEADGAVVAAGWIRFARGTQFGTLWGGATLSEWRGGGTIALWSRTARAWRRTRSPVPGGWTRPTRVARSWSGSASSR